MPETKSKSSVVDYLKIPLPKLWAMAEELGRIRVGNSQFNKAPRCYTVRMEFKAIPGVTAEIRSEYGVTVHDGLAQIVNKATKLKEAYGG